MMGPAPFRRAGTACGLRVWGVWGEFGSMPGRLWHHVPAGTAHAKHGLAARSGRTGDRHGRTDGTRRRAAFRRTGDDRLVLAAAAVAVGTSGRGQQGRAQADHRGPPPTPYEHGTPRL